MPDFAPVDDVMQETFLTVSAKADDFVEGSNFRKMIADEKLGKNTLMMFVSEQGYEFPGGKWTCYEDGLKAACVAWWPGKIKPGSETDAVVDYTDFVPTFLDLADADSTGTDGSSFADVLAGTPESADAKYAFGIPSHKNPNGNRTANPIRSVCDNRYRLIVNYTPSASLLVGSNKSWVKEWKAASVNDEQAQLRLDRVGTRPEVQLFDHQTDPFEMKNMHVSSGEMHG
jgi:arylsulfatase A-like enzyme